MNNMKSVCILIALLLATVSAYGQPQINNIEGLIQNGEKISITGDAFGTNTNTAPLIHDNFEDGVVGESISTGEWLNTQHEGKYSTANPQSGSQSAHWNFSTGDDDFQNYYQEIGAQNAIFASIYVYNDAYGNVIKLPRIKSGHFYSGTPGMDMQGRSYASTPNEYTTIVGATNLEDILDGTARNIGRADLPMRQWNRIDIYFKLSDPGTANSEIAVDYIGENINIRDPLAVSGFQNRAETDTDVFLESFMLGFALTQHEEEGGGDVYIDDVYVNNTRARVEFGNKPNFDDCTHREIQIPSTWTDNKIELTIEQGASQDGENAYVFIIDSNGIASSGYLVTFGKLGELLPPKNISANGLQTE